MANPFAALEGSANNLIVSNLSNKTLLIDYVEVSGIFDDRFIEDGFIETTNPIFTIKTSDAPENEKCAKVEDENGKVWDIVGIQNDGTGITILELRKKWDM